VRRITKAALGGIAGCALVLGGTQVASGADKFHDALTDFLTADGPFDSATATVRISINEGTDKTTFSVGIKGINASSIAGSPLGSHLHTGPCVEGDFGDSTVTPAVLPGSQAGPHYNDQVVTEGKKFPGQDVDPADLAEISPNTEVWFNFLPDQDGTAEDRTTVPFVPVDPDGVMSIVVHVLETNPDTGGAGTRQACFPLSVSGIFPTTVPTE
jgi:Cu/Zn superoxide dismutase